MQKKMIILTLMALTGLFLINSLKPLKNKNKISSLVETQYEDQSSTFVPQKDTLVKKENLSPAEALEQEIAQLQNELSSINVEKELNSNETSPERRKWIISKMNLYAKKMGLLAKIEIALMTKDIEK